MSRTKKRAYTGDRQYFGQSGQRVIKKAAKRMNRAERRRAKVDVQVGQDPFPHQPRSRAEWIL